MSLSKENKKTDNWTGKMSKSLLRAAYENNFHDAEIIISKDKNSHKESDFNNRNALQIAIINSHEKFALLLLRRTDISAIKEDTAGLNSVHLSLRYSSLELCEAVYDRWRKEIEKGNSHDDNHKGKIISLNKPKPL